MIRLVKLLREVDVAVAGGDGGLLVAGGDRAQQLGMHAATSRRLSSSWWCMK
jgi:hypothetical protein